MNTTEPTENAINQVLTQYKDLFENLQPSGFQLEFAKVYERNIYFKDPFNEVRGISDVSRIFQHMFENLHEPQFRIHAMAGQDQTGFLEWRFYFKRKPNAPTQQINGMSKILINQASKVIVHIDYWDSGEYVLRKVPLIGAINNWIAKKLKAN
ncbi:nuclear transport factor 2 family protein [Thiomicrospira sp. R3]|uniref:nuclear transport factor 2 family protein n=1 Tax=Thiomicrospira sp. R3 TaxID=3035472 RepID=UPI00259BD232|nr:nuclear transport factor 2 family protein [Thiomicrospira sp. R3]WFE67787.1 nuclear transport factor 2 family protein [Thiomicrospira sp. R3]